MKHCPKCGRETDRGYNHTLACPAVISRKTGQGHRCSQCQGMVNFSLDTGSLWCSPSIDKKHIEATEESIVDGYTPAAWWPAAWFNLGSQAPQGDPDNCPKCGKAMTIMGLNRAYPPKKDTDGNPICPHCGYSKGYSGGSLSGNPTMMNGQPSARIHCWCPAGKGGHLFEAGCNNRQLPAAAMASNAVCAECWKAGCRGIDLCWDNARDGAAAMTARGTLAWIQAQIDSGHKYWGFSDTDAAVADPTHEDHLKALAEFDKAHQTATYSKGFQIADDLQLAGEEPLWFLIQKAADDFVRMQSEHIDWMIFGCLDEGQNHPNQDKCTFCNPPDYGDYDEHDHEYEDEEYDEDD